MTTRVVFDNNIISYVADQLAASELNRLLAARQIELRLPPSVLLEVTANPNARVRARHVEQMVALKGSRLRTEADLESEELIAEIRRLRPSWVLRWPNYTKVDDLRAFWTRRIWREAVASHDALYEHGKNERESMLLHNMQLQKDVRAQHAGLDNKFPEDISTARIWATAEVPAYMSWWDGTDCEAWRIMLAQTWIRGSATNSTFRDWLGAFVDLKAFRDDATVGTFWLSDIQESDLRRSWLHMFAVDYIQRFTKITRGNSVDQQHAAYLPDCDLFVSSDRRYIDVLSVAKASAPFPLPELRLLKRDPDVSIIDQIDAIIST